MKKNEAISILATSSRPREPKDRARYDEAVKMAIEALKQPDTNCSEFPNNSDTISRQAAIDAMETWDKFGCDPDGKLVRYDDDKHYIPYVHYEDMVHAIKHLPSAQQEQRWIPCSERLPEEYQEGGE